MTSERITARQEYKVKNKLELTAIAGPQPGTSITLKRNKILKNELIRFHIGPKLSSNVLEKKTVDYDGCAVNDQGLVFFSTCSSDGKSFYLHRWDPS